LNSPSSTARICKYVAKGFECACPGTRREAFKQWHKGYSSYSGVYRYKSRGIGTLFEAEEEVLRARDYDGFEEEFVEKITGRLTAVEAGVIASKLAGKLGRGVDEAMRAAEAARRRRRLDEYDEYDEYYGEGFSFADYGGCPKWCTNSYGFIRESFRRDVAVRLGDARRGMAIGMTFWAFTDAGRFQPSEAHLEELYLPKALASLEEEEMANRIQDVAARAARMPSVRVKLSVSGAGSIAAKLEQTPDDNDDDDDNSLERLLQLAEDNRMFELDDDDYSRAILPVPS
jgi:hypothetical protein